MLPPPPESAGMPFSPRLPPPRFLKQLSEEKQKIELVCKKSVMRQPSDRRPEEKEDSCCRYGVAAYVVVFGKRKVFFSFIFNKYVTVWVIYLYILYTKDSIMSHAPRNPVCNSNTVFFNECDKRTNTKEQNKKQTEQIYINSNKALTKNERLCK